MSKITSLEQNFGHLPAEQKIDRLSAAILKRQTQLECLPAESEAAAHLGADIANLTIERDAVTLRETLGLNIQAAHDMAMHQHGLRFDESDPAEVKPELTLIKNPGERSA